MGITEDCLYVLSNSKQIQARSDIIIFVGTYRDTNRELLNESFQHTAFIAETGSHPPCCCCARSSRGITADCL